MNSKIFFELRDQQELNKLIQACFAEQTKIIQKSIEDNSLTLMTTSQCLEFLQISRTKLWQLTMNGVIPFIRVGNSRRFQKKEVLKALSTNIKNL